MKNIKSVVSVISPLLLIANLAVAGQPEKELPPRQAPAPRQQKPEQKAPVNTSWLKVEGEASLDYYAKDSQDYETNLRLTEAKVRVTAQIAKGIKAVIGAKLERMLIDNGANTAGDAFDVEKFINEAYLEIRMNEITGTPVAVIIGKSAMAFGQQASKLPMYQDNLLYKVGKMDEVIGVTVKLEKQMLAGILNSAEVSVFGNAPETLQLGDAAGMSIRLTKDLTRELKATASGLVVAKDSNYNWSDAEKRAALGFVYDNGQGNWKAYAEGIYLEGNADHPNSNYGATAGVAIAAGPGEVVLEYSYLEKTAHEIAAAYNLPIGHNLVISPEVRHSFNDDGTEDTRFGVRTKVKFSSDDQGRRN